MARTDAADDAALAELGRRIERHRLQAGWTQADLAREAGLGKATIERLEAGNAVRTNSLIRVLRALRLLENLDALIPDPPHGRCTRPDRISPLSTVSPRS